VEARRDRTGNPGMAAEGVALAMAGLPVREPRERKIQAVSRNALSTLVVSPRWSKEAAGFALMPL
jgi:hypothetical protein